MIDLQIPYGTGIQIKCPICGYEGLPNAKKKGSNTLEIVLYICGIFPGIIYDIWRKSSIVCCCAKCGCVNVKEINGDDEIVNNLLRINKIQNYAFVAAVLFFVLMIFGTRSFNSSNQKNSYQQYTNIVSYEPTSTNINTQKIKVEPEAKPKIETEESEVTQHGEIIQPQETVIKQKPKSIKEQVNDIIDEAAKKINETNKNKSNFGGASCSGDCSRRIIDINFINDTSLYDFGIDNTMKSYAEITYNTVKEVKDVPITVNLLYGGKLYRSYTASKDGVSVYEDKSDKIRAMVQGVVNGINKEFREGYTANKNFSGAYCVGDCVNGVINIDWTAYPYIYPYDNIVAGIASSRAVNLSFGMREKPVIINLNIGGKLFVTCSGANTAIQCKTGDYYNK